MGYDDHYINCIYPGLGSVDILQSTQHRASTKPTITSSSRAFAISHSIYNQRHFGWNFIFNIPILRKVYIDIVYVQGSFTLPGHHSSFRHQEEMQIAPADGVSDDIQYTVIRTSIIITRNVEKYTTFTPNGHITSTVHQISSAVSIQQAVSINMSSYHYIPTPDDIIITTKISSIHPSATTEATKTTDTASETATSSTNHYPRTQLSLIVEIVTTDDKPSTAHYKSSALSIKQAASIKLTLYHYMSTSDDIAVTTKHIISQEAPVSISTSPIHENTTSTIYASSNTICHVAEEPVPSKLTSSTLPTTCNISTTTYLTLIKSVYVNFMDPSLLKRVHGIHTLQHTKIIHHIVIDHTSSSKQTAAPVTSIYISVYIKCIAAVRFKCLCLYCFTFLYLYIPPALTIIPQTIQIYFLKIHLTHDKLTQPNQIKIISHIYFSSLSQIYYPLPKTFTLCGL